MTLCGVVATLTEEQVHTALSKTQDFASGEWYGDGNVIKWKRSQLIWICTVCHSVCKFCIDNLDQVILLADNQGPVVQSVVSLTSSLRIISLTVLADSTYNILIFIAEKNVSAYNFSAKKFQHICVSLDVNFNESLTNDVVSFEQLGPDVSMPS